MGIIGSIRKHSWLAVLVVGIAIVLFILQDCSKNRTQDRTVAKIGSDAIDIDEFSSKKDKLAYLYGISDNNGYEIKNITWQTILQERLIGKEAKALGIDVSNDELSDMFFGLFPDEEVARFVYGITGTYSSDVAKSVENMMMSDDSNVPDSLRIKWALLKERVRENRIQQKYAAMVLQGFYMPTPLVDKIAEIKSKSYDARVAFLPYSDANVEMTEADYRNYYNNNRKKLNYYAFLKNPDGWRDVSYVVFTAKPSQSDMTEISKTVNEWYGHIKTLEGDRLIKYVNSLQGKAKPSTYVYDSTYLKISDFSMSLAQAIENVEEGGVIPPTMLSMSGVYNNSIDKEVYINGNYVTGRVLSTEMRPDSVQFSAMIIPTNKYPVQNGAPAVSTTPEEAKKMRDNAFDSIKSGLISFEDAVRRYSKADTSKGGDQGWNLDNSSEMMNEIVHHSVGEIFAYEYPSEMGYLLIKVTDKTEPIMKYRVALAVKTVEPSNATRDAANELANEFLGKYTNCKDMIAGAQEDNREYNTVSVTILSDQFDSKIKNVRELVRWAYNEDTKIGDVYGGVVNIDDYYVVAALKDVYKPGHLSYNQAKELNTEYFQPLEIAARIEKCGEQLASKATEAMSGGKSIDAVASALGVQVENANGIVFGDNKLGSTGRNLEFKVNGTVAAKGKGLVGPVIGNNGVYVVNVDSANQIDKPVVETLRKQYEDQGRSGIQNLIQILKKHTKVDDSNLINQ